MVSSFFTRACALAFVAVLGGALVANAAPINVSIVDTNPADAGYSSLPVVNGQHILGTLTATQTVNVGNSGEDRWVIALSSFNGDAAGTTMSGMQGTFTPGTGGSIYVGTGANEFGNGNWPIETASGHGGESYTSFIEFDSTISGTINSSTGPLLQEQRPSVFPYRELGLLQQSGVDEHRQRQSSRRLVHGKHAAFGHQQSRDNLRHDGRELSRFLQRADSVWPTTAARFRAFRSAPRFLSRPAWPCSFRA